MDICKALEISRQAYYKHEATVKLNEEKSAFIVDMVKTIRTRHPKLGTRKLHVMIRPYLEAEQISIGKDSLFELLAANRLLIRKKRRNAPKTTDSYGWRRWAGNLIEGRSLLELPIVIVSDITYLQMENGFIFLCLMTELHSRMILGYGLSKSMTVQELCLPAVKQAVAKIPPPLRQGAIHHTDRGSQYFSITYRGFLGSEGIISSATQTGSPYDNAVAERMNGIIKNEYLLHPLKTMKEAKEKVAHAIKMYNSERPHLALKMKTPEEVWNSMTKDLLL